jgi:hypothetical protein
LLQCSIIPLLHPSCFINQHPERENHMASTANTTADKAGNTARNDAEQAAELSKRTSERAVDAAREATDTTEDATRRGLQLVQRTTGAAGEVQREVMRRSAEGTAEFGQTLMTVLTEQTQHNLKTWTALTGAVDWDQVIKAVDWERVAQIQTEFLRVSMERSAQLTKGYLEITQSVVTAASEAVQDQAKKAA